MRSDLLQALRALLRARWFAAGAASTFALGVGINAAVFSSVDRLLFRPLPYASPDRLFVLQEVDRASGQPRSFLNARYAAEARARLDVIEIAATLGDSSGYFMTPDLDEPEIRLSHVTWRMLDLAGVRPVIGRGFSEDDGRAPGSAVVLTWEGWQARYGGDVQAIGRRIYHRRGSIPIVGVLPPGFIPPGAVIDPNISGLTTMAEVEVVIDNQARTVAPTLRLRDGVAPAAAQARLEALVAEIDRERPVPDRGASTVRLVPIRLAMFGSYRPYLLLVVAASGFVLLLACANLVILFLVRGQSRQWEAAVRTSLGASSGRLVRETLFEALVVCLVGTVISIVVLRWGGHSLEAVLPAVFSRFRAPALDARVLGFALGSAVLASLLAALVPAVLSGRLDVLPILQRASAAHSPRHTRSGRVLLGGEAALGAILVAGAVVTARSFVGLMTTELGFEPRDAYLINMAASPASDAIGRRAEMLRVLARLRQEPGIETAGASPQLSVLRTGTTPFAAAGPPCCRWLVSNGYLEAAGVPIVAGRAIDESDIRSSAPVAVLSVRGVAQVWPGLNPASAVGRPLRFAGEPAREVVGVVGDTRRGHDDAVQPALYLPLGDGAAGLIVVRTKPGVSLPYSKVRPVVEGASGSSLWYVRPMARMYARPLEAPRFRAALFASFAVVALLVAMAGLYALAGFEVTSRQREFGVRLALGATPRDVVRQMLLESARPVIAGTAVGLAASWWAARFVQSFLHQVDARDPLALASVGVVLVCTSLAAAVVPARRAARTDPAGILRAQ